MSAKVIVVEIDPADRRRDELFANQQRVTELEMETVEYRRQLMGGWPFKTCEGD
jgi:hypothetical protein